jgi:thiamine-monophosphate kinase
VYEAPVSGRIESETDLIQTYLAPLAAGFHGAFGLQDDAALIAGEPGHDLVVTTDPVIAGVHFFATDRADDIAWKALAVNISDLAAKGATPLAYTMALALPEAPERAWMANFADGLRSAQTAFGCHLIGGDTDCTPGPLSISITAFGRVPSGQMVRRGTAAVGDHVFVTGTLGDAALGLDVHRPGSHIGEQLPGGDRSFLAGRYLRPSPRIEMIPVLRAFASAALDISDGLTKDLARLAAAAGVGVRVQAGALPLSAPARKMIASEPNCMSAVVAGGGDYEIIFSVPPGRLIAFHKAVRAVPAQVTEIGVLGPGQGVAVYDENGRALHFGASGYDHFR